MPDLLANLNAPQLAAVTLPPQHALILAGAGSGKTRVLTTRIAWLISTGQVGPQGILAVTFTNKAAKEMQSRLAAMLPINTRGMRQLYADLVHKANIDDDVKVLVIRGEGDNFGGGGDLPEQSEMLSQSDEDISLLSEFGINDPGVRYPPRNSYRFLHGLGIQRAPSHTRRFSLGGLGNHGRIKLTPFNLSEKRGRQSSKQVHLQGWILAFDVPKRIGKLPHQS